MNNEKNNAVKLAGFYRHILWAITFVLITGSFTYTQTVASHAAQERQTVKQEVQEQAKEIKNDLKERIQETEYRLLQALRELREQIRNDRVNNR